MGTRKYFSEFGINVTVLSQYLGRQRELEQMAEFPERCNLYIVSKRPRITIDPRTVRFGDDWTMSGVVHLQRGSSFEEAPFKVSTKKMPRRPAAYLSDWPHDTFRILDRDGNEMAGGVTALAVVAYGLLHPRRAAQEVIYVGQAFGKRGDRTAFDRLKSHSTLQRIYSEARPDVDIWLNLCKISDLNLLTEFNPRIPARESDEADDEHLRRVMKRMHGAGFEEREAIAIAEAGLIRYFRPPYNHMFKENYPDPQHVHINTCYDLELATIGIELQAQETLSVLFSNAIPKPSTFHYCRYVLHETEGYIRDWYGGRSMETRDLATDADTESAA